MLPPHLGCRPQQKRPLHIHIGVFLRLQATSRLCLVLSRNPDPHFPIYEMGIILLTSQDRRESYMR